MVDTSGIWSKYILAQKNYALHSNHGCPIVFIEVAIFEDISANIVLKIFLALTSASHLSILSSLTSCG